jgi:hypothetical protein
LKIDEKENDVAVILPHLLVSRSGDAILDTPDKLLEDDIVYLINCCENESSNTTMNRTHLSSREGFNLLDLNMKDESHEKLDKALSRVFPLVKKAKQGRNENVHYTSFPSFLYLYFPLCLFIVVDCE